MTRRRDSDLNGHKSWEFERSVSIKKNSSNHKAKVRTFWEAHKIWKNLPHGLYIYLVNVQTTRKIFFKFCVLLRKSELHNTESEFAQNMYVHLQMKSFGKYLGQNVSGSQYGQSQSE